MGRKRIQIRKGVFETNSSNTHMLTLFSREDWNKYQDGELFRKNGCDDSFITKEEALKIMNDNVVRVLKEQAEEDEPKINVVKVKANYDKVDKTNYRELHDFMCDIDKCLFGHVPMGAQEYYERYCEDRMLEYDTYEENINGQPIVAECFHGRDG
jgi:hypothetical protein